MYLSFGAAIREYRASGDIPQKVLAAMLGVSVSTVAKWEGGHPVPFHHRNRLAAIMAGRGSRLPVNLRAMLSEETGVACITSASGVVLDVSRAGVLRSNGKQLALIGQNIYNRFNENSSFVRENYLREFVKPRADLVRVSFIDRCIIDPRRAVRRNWTRVVVDGSVYRYTLDEDLGPWNAQADLDLQLVLRDELERR